MPVFGVPKSLEAMMTTLFENQTVNGWCIFKDRNSDSVTLITGWVGACVGWKTSF